jgi:hypothetical protein
MDATLIACEKFEARSSDVHNLLNFFEHEFVEFLTALAKTSLSCCRHRYRFESFRSRSKQIGVLQQYQYQTKF